MNGKYLTVTAAAEYSGLSTRTMWRWIGKGAVRAFRPGGVTLVLRVSLERHIEMNPVVPVDLKALEDEGRALARKIQEKMKAGTGNG